MQTIFPKKLETGDTIMVISPSMSLSLMRDESVIKAVEVFQALGFNIVFGKNAKEADNFKSSSISSRVEDIHQAFLDPSVNMVLCTMGGYNSNQLLDNLDYTLIKNNPKIFTGYSDITALSNAILAKTGLVTYSSPTFSGFAKDLNLDFSITSFVSCFAKNAPYTISQSEYWFDEWKKDLLGKPIMNDNDGHWVLSAGSAKGITIGGNLNTFRLLYGTQYMPQIDGDIVLFLEDDSDSVGDFMIHEFDRNIVSLTQQSWFNQVTGIIFGRFQTRGEISRGYLVDLIGRTTKLQNIPIIANVDFGHNKPMISFPVGGTVIVDTNKRDSQIEIVTH